MVHRRQRDRLDHAERSDRRPGMHRFPRVQDPHRLAGRGPRRGPLVWNRNPGNRRRRRDYARRLLRTGIRREILASATRSSDRPKGRPCRWRLDESHGHLRGCYGGRSMRWEPPPSRARARSLGASLNRAARTAPLPACSRSRSSVRVAADPSGDEAPFEQERAWSPRDNHCFRGPGDQQASRHPC